MNTDPRHDVARLWVSFLPGTTENTSRVRFSRVRPASGMIYAALLSRGQMAQIADMEIVIATGQGADGKSAYDLARDAGYGGTLTQWLTTLVGADGKSAYQIARDAGYGGTATQWLASLKGDKGDPGQTPLGNVTVAEAITLAIGVGIRRVQITVPSSWGLAVGDPLTIVPTAAPSAGFSLHDVAVVSATRISVGVGTPALAALASYSIPARVYRLT